MLNDKQQASQNAIEYRPSPNTWFSGHLLNGNSYARILHEGQEYRLQKTRSGKLILTK
jgi:hemin uptake protein HemP